MRGIMFFNHGFHGLHGLGVRDNPCDQCNPWFNGEGKNG